RTRRRAAPLAGRSSRSVRSSRLWRRSGRLSSRTLILARAMMSTVPRRFADWFRVWWLRVPMPRELSVAFTLLYALALGAGIVTLIYPPVSLSREVGGPQVMASVGALLIVGALLSMYGGAREHWKVERIGLWLCSWALLIYAGIVLVLHFSSSGSQLTQLFVI